MALRLPTPTTLKSTAQYYDSRNPAQKWFAMWSWERAVINTLKRIVEK